MPRSPLMVLFVNVLFIVSQGRAQTWVMQSSGTTASLRGISAVDSKAVWASGSAGTWLHTIDGGNTWHSGRVEGAEELDFRGVAALNRNTAVLMSSGSGDKSRIYKSQDGGAHWKLLFNNPDQKGFFDAISFRDSRNGILFGDAVGGHMTVFTTADGGEHWRRRDTPPALPGEGGFAASNSCLAVYGKTDAWFGTGGPGAARIFHSRDGGETWAVATTPIRNDSASAGIFSLAFRDAKVGIAVGGDYAKDKEAQHNIAATSDGGLNWVVPTGTAPHGFRSAVVFAAGRKIWIATGTSGSDFSKDDGVTWIPFDSGSFNALSAAPGGAVWAVGAGGRIARLK